MFGSRWQKAEAWTSDDENARIQNGDLGDRFRCGFRVGRPRREPGRSQLHLVPWRHRRKAIRPRRGWQDNDLNISRISLRTSTRTRAIILFQNSICGVRQQTSCRRPRAIWQCIFQRCRRKPPMTATGSSLPSGRTIYQEGMPDANIVACVVCHGPNAEGVGQIPRLGGLRTPI